MFELAILVIVCIHLITANFWLCIFSQFLTKLCWNVWVMCKFLCDSWSRPLSQIVICLRQLIQKECRFSSRSLAEKMVINWLVIQEKTVKLGNCQDMTNKYVLKLATNMNLHYHHLHVIFIHEIWFYAMYYRRIILE
jgi:hypothetical protein